MGDTTKITTATGELFVAPVGSAMPTDAESALDTAFKSTGFCSEDGMKKNITRSVEDIKEWGGKTVMSTQTEYGETHAVTFLEADNIEVKKVVFGDSNVDSSGHVTTDGSELPNKAFVFNLVGKGGTKRRLVIPNGKVTEVGEIGYVNNAPVSYPVTIAAYPDENGKYSYEY